MRAAPVLTAAEMRACEARAMASGAVSGRALMERAGRGAAEAIAARAGAARIAVILCGPGNNGGDGYVIARHLREAGWEVHVCAMGDPARLPPDAAANHAAWSAMGPVHPYTAEVIAGLDLPEDAPVVLVDALFGIGQRAPLYAVVAPARDWIAARAPRPFVAAVDLPTGYDADTGAALADTPMPCDLAVTFHARKPVHAMGALGAAEIAVVDIGLSS
ncbi:yjeF N-terminal region [Roseivivax lentus]|uniref:NAD(P)H-hydrate epimerase n=1 Tax=Roseivivax lentus TaxID=633194 RepID=A0A1N7MZS3_9RHOB|nr:NAD(P)H-hydrate epimerase [Roseivivax lentus]SIS91606.1 yjeF N-terminal region [Roseivivax lentus]